MRLSLDSAGVAAGVGVEGGAVAGVKGGAGVEVLQGTSLDASSRGDEAPALSVAVGSTGVAGRGRTGEPGVAPGVTVGVAVEA